MQTLAYEEVGMAVSKLGVGCEYKKEGPSLGFRVRVVVYEDMKQYFFFKVYLGSMGDRGYKEGFRDEGF